MTNDEKWLKALKIQPCSIPEPARDAVVASMDVEIAAGEVKMSIADFNSLLTSNHDLHAENQELIEDNGLMTELVLKRAREAKRRQMGWLVATGSLAAAVIAMAIGR